MDTNYFVCTLGQAALGGVQRPFRNVNHLIDEQASKRPQSPAVGFYIPDKQRDTFRSQVLTFKQVRCGVALMARTIEAKVKIHDGQTVGLLCNSSPAFLFTWLALIRLGHPVLLIAPQCSASAITHLSKACDAHILFHDGAHEKLACEAMGFSKDAGSSALATHHLPFEADDEVFETIGNESEIGEAWSDVSETDVAYLHHTSGTSSGIPKPIPQTHRGGVAVLPSLDGSSAATFTTTPLYHGGVADLFRAWASSALIWLFPAQYVPITAPNVVRCLEASALASTDESHPTVKYFSSVPYVLQMMAQDKEGLSLLQNMDVVGVGGAALPSEIGNQLVENKVNLVSRYGSAECGFLMSSYRDFILDKEWQFLRKSEKVDQLRFEERSGGQSELIVQSEWPHMAKRNREDGSFATSDLFAPHPNLANAWKYHSRADSQLTLITGKKFDPSPLEESLAASTDLLQGVLIFGNSKPYPGALLFRSELATDVPDDEFIQKIAPRVEKLNKESQSHARVPRNMLVPMTYTASPLEKSSKGTILRGQAEEKFSGEIENAYNKTSFTHTTSEDDDLEGIILELIESVVGTNGYDEKALTTDTDLFSYGVDSVACVQIRHALSQLLSKGAEQLPLTIVEESGTISRLASTIQRLRNGETTQARESQHELVEEMVHKYSAFVKSQHPSLPRPTANAGFHVLLTGPTGLLGAHLLSQLLFHPQVEKVYLLVRGATPHAAKERVIKALTSRKLHVPSDFDARAQVLPCKLSEARLGLSNDEYQMLADRVEKIFHLAWSVNFLVSLRSLASTHLAGLQNLLNFALNSRKSPEVLFCSSVASVSNELKKGNAPEDVVKDTSACGSTGYSQSKLAAELICSRCAETTSMRHRITILRVGQLSGDTNEGIWNATEAYPLMLASSRVTGVLPKLETELLGWLPVDIAAKAYLEAAFGIGNSTSLIKDRSHVKHPEPVRVFHLINTSEDTTFNGLANTLQKSGESIRMVSVQEWLDKLEQLQKDEKTKYHPALKLLSFWKEIYGPHKPGQGSKAVQGEDGTNGVSVKQKHNNYDTQLSRAAMPSLDTAIGPLSEEYMLKLWKWIKENVD